MVVLMLAAPIQDRTGQQLYLADVERRAGSDGVASAVVAVVERVCCIGHAVGGKFTVCPNVVIVQLIDHSEHPLLGEPVLIGHAAVQCEL